MIECAGADPTGADTQYANAERHRPYGVGTLQPPRAPAAADLLELALPRQILLEGEVPTPIIRSRHLKGCLGSRSGMGLCDIGQRVCLA